MLRCDQIDLLLMIKIIFLSFHCFLTTSSSLNFIILMRDWDKKKHFPSLTGHRMDIWLLMTPAKCQIMIFSKISRNSSIDPECDGCDMMEEEINITNPSHSSPTLIIKCKSSTYDGQFRSHCWWFKIFFQSKIISPDPEIISAPAWMKINQIKTNCIEEGVPRNWSDEFNLNIWIYSKNISNICA